MTSRVATSAPVRHPHQLFIDGRWVASTAGDEFAVLDSNDEEVYFTVALANEADAARAVAAARAAFDDGPWPRMGHQERATYLRALAEALRRRDDTLADIWPRESGALYTSSKGSADGYAKKLEFYADMATNYPWEEQAKTTPGAGFSMIVREPVGVVTAIVPWNWPLGLAMNKLAPALVSGCTTLLKAPPEAPAALYVLAECAEEVGLPAGVLNVLTADRQASEALVRSPGVDKVAFTGSTAVGQRIASLMAERVGRVTLELGGKSPAVILDDADLEAAAKVVAAAECHLTGQVCASLTRIIVTRQRHDEFVDILGAEFASKKVGNAFEPDSLMGPLVSARQRERVESYIAQGIDGGAQLVTGGKRPADLQRGYFIEPTVFAGVDNSSAIAQEEIFGPVLTVIAADDEADAVRIANDTIYGLNASVFTADVDRARDVAGQLRCGTIGHNAFRIDAEIAFGGFKQSGIGREGGREGLLPYLETKVLILDGPPKRYR
jgi:aldehyde dehydrogenase (NAD+)